MIQFKPLLEAEQDAVISKMAENWQGGTHPREKPMVHEGLDLRYGHCERNCFCRGTSGK